MLIPTFAMGRAQELFALIEDLWTRSNWKYPVYYSAGLTDKVKFYYKLFANWLNEGVKSELVCSGKSPFDRLDRNFALSAARSALFNAVLAARVANGTWNRLLDGDVANLDGSGSIFPVAVVDEVLAERNQRLDIHPTGPLHGRGESRTGPAIAQLEDTALAPWAHWVSGMAAAGLEHERRALRLNVQGLEWDYAGTDLTLRFRLGKGAFATSVLAELIDPASAAQVDESDDG